MIDEEATIGGGAVETSGGGDKMAEAGATVTVVAGAPPPPPVLVMPLLLAMTLVAPTWFTANCSNHQHLRGVWDTRFSTPSPRNILMPSRNLSKMATTPIPFMGI